MSLSLPQMAEAARALGTPLYADLPGDIRVSFEFFPPKTEAMERTLWESVETLTPLAPSFVSVTYGAGGTTRERTHATVARIARDTSLKPAAHLTCVDASRDEIDAVARDYWAAGVRHIVALRGDPPRAGERFTARPDGYASAADLVAGLKRVADFELSVSAYPELHPDASPTTSTRCGASSTPGRRGRSPSSSSSPTRISAFATPPPPPESPHRSFRASCR
jgi:methylenetetrahydrofolate reductase (NADPH)